MSKTKVSELPNVLRTAVMRVSRRLRVEATAEQITPAQMSVLTLLLKGDRRIGQLADSENVRAPSMSRTVNNLEALGLVERISTPDDGRQVLVSLTELGRTAIRDTRAMRTRWLQGRLRDLSSAERATLAEAAHILLKIAER